MTFGGGHTGVSLLLAALLSSGCSESLAGRPVTGHEGVGVVNVDRVLLSPEEMQAVTGAGEDLTIIPTMDGKSPIDVDTFDRTVPAECRFVFAESETFGGEFTDFHKTTFQNPARAAVISEGAAVYPNAAIAEQAFDALGVAMSSCGNSGAGAVLIGRWNVGPTRMTARPGDCGRDYRLKSAVIVEITYCGLPETVPEKVMAAVLSRIPD